MQVVRSYYVLLLRNVTDKIPGLSETVGTVYDYQVNTGAYHGEGGVVTHRWSVKLSLM